MHFITTFAVAAFAAVAVAQTATTSAVSGSYTCAAQNIVDACKSTIDAQVAACQGNDWDCLCTQYTNLLTCYNNCPSDPIRSSVQNQVTQFCAAASAYGSSTHAATSTSGTAAAPTSASVTTSTRANAASSSSSPTPTGNAASSLQVSGGMAAIVLVGLGLMA